MSSASLPINRQIHYREDLPRCGSSRYISQLPSFLPPLSWLPSSFTPTHPNNAHSHLSTFVFAHPLLSALNAISPVSSHSSSLHKSTFPLRIIHCALWKAPFLPKADCRLLCFHGDWKAGTTPAYSSTPSTMYVQKHLLMNEWTGNNICLFFWGWSHDDGLVNWKAFYKYKVACDYYWF